MRDGTKPKILFTTSVLGHPAIGGPNLRIENSIKALNQCSELYIYSRLSLKSIGGRGALNFYKQHSKAFFFMPSVRKHSLFFLFIKRAINYITRRVMGKGIFKIVRSSNFTKDYRYLLDLADKLSIDIIWLGYGNISYPLLKYIKKNSGYKVVLDTDSVWSRFVLRGMPYAKNEEKREKIKAEGEAKQKEEEWGAQLADVTTAVSEVDAAYYAIFVNDKSKIKIFSNVIDLENYKRRPNSKEMKRPALYLAGSFFEGSPMEEAARWTIEEIMPEIWAEYPNIHFYILGAGSKRVLKDVKDNRISVLGKVPSVLPYLCNVDIALVPLKFESGTRFKILEAAACGIPIVSTTLGAEGIPVSHEKNIIIADTSFEFVRSIKLLLKDKEKAKSISSNCRKLIEQNYSLLKAQKEAEVIIVQLMGMDQKG